MKLVQVETGQNTMKIKSNINLLSNDLLSIQASLNGLSFCVLDITESTIVFFKEINFKEQKNPLEVEKLIINEFENNLFLQREFKKVKLIHHNNLCTFVPKILFNDKNLIDYLKFDNKVFNSDFIAADEIASREIMAVYVPFVNLNNLFFECFGSFEYHHASKILLDNILKITNDFSNKLFCNVSKSSFELMYIKNGELNLFNSFEFNTPEDFIYYVLFTIEQLQIDTENIDFVLLGDICINDNQYNILYKYIRNVSFGEKINNYTISDSYKNLLNNYNQFSLLNSF